MKKGKKERGVERVEKREQRGLPVYHLYHQKQISEEQSRIRSQVLKSEAWAIDKWTERGRVERERGV